MRSKLTLLLAALFIAFTTTQCTKKKSDPTTTEDTTPAPAGANSVADIIAANGSAANTVTVDAVSATTLTINGNIFEIPANAFVTSSGGTITGVVNLTVKTIMTKPQIIFTGAGANSSSSKLVVTKGCIKSTASQNSQSLRLSGGGNFFINVPDPLASPPPMKKYYAPKVTATDSTAFWALGTDITDIPQTTFTTSSTVYHKASLDSLKWLNVGVQDNNPAPKTAVTVSITSSSFTKANTLVYLSYNGSLTVGAMFEITPGVFRISNVPSGQAANIVAIAAIEGQYYCTIMPYTVPAPGASTVNLTMQSVSQSSMQAMVAALP
jgi:hypothetical protein